MLYEVITGPVMRLASKDTHNAFASPMEEYILPNQEKVTEAIRASYNFV